ncbi:MAG: ATP-binding protein, partial [Myxococcota bacterium]
MIDDRERERLNRRVARERTARRSAEMQAEEMLRTLYERQREAELMRAVATTANQAQYVRDAVNTCLRQLSIHVGANIGHAWYVPDGQEILTATGLWFFDEGLMWAFSDPQHFDKLRGMTDMSELHKGEGLPGRVLETGRPAWIEDVSSDRGWSRNISSKELGVRAGFAMPVLIEDRVAAVLEFFFIEHRPVDERVLGLAADIGSQIGRVIERHRAQSKLAQARDDLQQKEARVRERQLELEQLNLDLQRQIEERDAADAANRAKSEFLANMSHEIRTPLTAVLGYADLLTDGELTEDDRLAHVRTIRRNGEHLLMLLNDMLDLSKIEAGKMSIETIETSPSRIVADVASLMRVRAIEKGLTFDVRYLTSVPDTIRTDPTRLRQVVMNLVGNAIKFTSKGGVRLTVRCERPTTEAPTLEIAVSDDGIGMTASQLSKLFQPFTQADTSTTRKYGGTGLGLVISKRLVEMMSGTVRVESLPGRGSTFLVSIPTGSLDGVGMVHDLQEAGSATPMPAQRSSVELGGVRVLLAEDGPDNQVLLTTLLRRAGATVTVADNGRIAVDKATTGTFDVILMDMQMPEMDGYQAAATLRRKGYTKPVVALTAHAMSTDRDRCLAAGCDDFLTKPVDRKLLLTTVRKWAGDRAATPTSTTAPAPTRRTPSLVPA